MKTTVVLRSYIIRSGSIKKLFSGTPNPHVQLGVGMKYHNAFIFVFIS